MYTVVVTLSYSWSGFKSQVGFKKDCYPSKELSLDEIARLQLYRENYSSLFRFLELRQWERVEQNVVSFSFLFGNDEILRNSYSITKVGEIRRSFELSMTSFLSLKR